MTEGSNERDYSLDIRGRRYRVRFVDARRLPDCFGDADSPSKTSHRQIRVLRGLEPVTRAGVLTHEVLHACQWDLDEDVVDEIAQCVVTALRSARLLAAEEE